MYVYVTMPYKEHWEKKYPNWEMLFNHQVRSNQLILIKSLGNNTSIKGIVEILSIIDDLRSSKMRLLAKYLGIDENFIIQDYIQEILEYLLKDANKYDAISFRHLTPYEEKIELNFDKEDWDGIKSEMKEATLVFDIIQKILSGYEDNEKSIIKRRVIEDYNKLSGDFKTRLNNLTDQYAKQYRALKDDDYRLNIRAVLFYMFEQCVIGKKTNKE